MDVLLESLHEEWLRLLGVAPRIVVALFVLAAFVGLGRLLARAVQRLVERGRLSATHRVFFRRLTVWAVSLVGLFVALNVLGLGGLGVSLLAGGSVTAVVLGFALRGIGENLLAGLFLAFSRPFEIGDLIQSGEFQGRVVGIELRSTHIRTADGRDIFLPSARLFNDPVVNFTKDGLRRLDFGLGIDWRDDAARARSIVLAAVRGVDGVLADPPAEVQLDALGASFVELKAYLWVDTFRKHRGGFAVRTDAMEAARRALLEAGYTPSSEVTTAIVVEERR